MSANNTGIVYKEVVEFDNNLIPNNAIDAGLSNRLQSVQCIQKIQRISV